MDSPKKRRRLGRLSCANSRPNNSPKRSEGIKENYIASRSSEPSLSKALPISAHQFSFTNDSNRANGRSHSLNDSSDSIDIFDDSMDSLPHPGRSNDALLPFKTADLPDLTSLRLQLPQHNNDSPVLQSLDPSNVTDDENLPATQPASAFILSSVVAYVEVKSGGDNRSRLVMRDLRNLGATIVETIRKNVTHIVFKGGRLSTYQKAVSRQIHLVSTAWIEQCRLSKKMVPEHMFPPYDLENYKDPTKHKLIKRVKSFQPDYDMDQEQRMQRIVKRMKRKREPVITAPTYVSVEDEFENEFEFMRRLISEKMNRYQSPGDCPMTRGLRTLAGPIDPKYDEYIQRPFSPTSSEDEMVPVPLAVKLLREIQSPNPNSLKRRKKHCESEPPDDGIEAAMAATFLESSDSDSSNIIPSKPPSLPATKSSQTPASFAPTAAESDDHRPPPAKLRKTEKRPALETTEIAPSTPAQTQSQRAVRKLFNAPRFDDSPKLILPSGSDTESSQSTSRTVRKPRRNGAGKTRRDDKTRQDDGNKTTTDMEMTTCVGNAILDDPSSLKTRSNRKSERIESRRSSAFFVPPKRSRGEGETKASEAERLGTIVCTSLTREEVDVIKMVVRQLGGFEVEDTVSRRTTHVVSMNKCTRRTVNVLRGIARGCWIVRKMWVLKSLEARRWVAEDEFEWTDFSPAVQQCRHERMAFSPFYRQDFFRDCGLIFVGGGTKPPRKELYELLGLCGGKPTYSMAAAKIVVGESGDRESVTYVSVQWVLDSVQAAAVKPTALYALTQ